MKKLMILIVLIVAVTTMYCDEKQEGMKIRTEYFKKNYTEADKKEKKQFNFGGELFNMKWAGYSEQGVGTVQFLRDKDSMKSFKKMITVVSCPKGIKFEEYISGYVGVVKPFIVNKPMIMSNKKSSYKKEIVTELVLVDKKSKNIEYSLFRAYENDAEEVTAVIFSQKFDYDSNIKDSSKMQNEINKNIEKWMTDIFKINFKVFG